VKQRSALLESNRPRDSWIERRRNKRRLRIWGGQNLPKWKRRDSLFQSRSMPSKTHRSFSTKSPLSFPLFPPKNTEGLANPRGLRNQSLMYSITLKSILNKVQPIKGFIYDRVTYSTAVPDTIEAVVVPRVGSQPRCSGCDRACPTYDLGGRGRRSEVGRGAARRGRKHRRWALGAHDPWRAATAIGGPRII